ncbi:hypothetical protein ACFOVU_16755 [Nocardiopsis sediminis]|uniref:Uncharacterized protein n=1 Tax=Nocardiopsis sediminis TaxID=1778267 RepID=A0ABV8FRT5_9ACTN
MTTRTAVLAATLALGAVLAGGCAAQDGIEEPAPSPPPSPTATSDTGRITEFTGLEVPEGASGLEVDVQTSDGGLTTLTAQFGTDRAGAEAFCTAENLGVYPDPEGPDDADAEAFGLDPAGIDTVDGSTACRGAEPTAGRVQREVLVLYPAEDEARVHLLAYDSP